MAEPQPALEHLADISEPPLELGFELAPIWWLVIVLVITLLTYLLWRWYRRWRFFAAKRQALQLLGQLELKQHPASEINLLLKRVLRHYQPEHPALGMVPADWQCWLSSQHHCALPDLTALLYQPGDDKQANRQFYLFAKVWLKHYKGKAPDGRPLSEAADA